MSPQFDPGTIVDDRYEIIAPIGSGGMGSVYRALEKALQRTVALKLMHSTLAGSLENQERFLREGKILSRLVHPGILLFYRLGVWKNEYLYLATEFLAGENFLDVIQRTDGLSPRRLLPLSIQLCEAMGFAHKQGVVHRDLKPNNIMIVDCGGTETVRILDFGLARVMQTGLMSQTLTHTGAVVGSIYYMSPEQCQGLRADERSDIYSLGCVLYEAVAGKPPLTADSSVGVMYKHVHDLPPPLPDMVSGEPVPPGLAAVIFKAMAKSPEDRYATMEEMRHELELVWQGRGTEICSASPEAKPGAVRFGVLTGIGTLLAAIICTAVIAPRLLPVPDVSTGETVARILPRRLPDKMELGRDPAARAASIRQWLARYDNVELEGSIRAHDYLVKDLSALGEPTETLKAEYQKADELLDRLFVELRSGKSLPPRLLMRVLDAHLINTYLLYGRAAGGRFIEKSVTSAGDLLMLHDRTMLYRTAAGIAQEEGDIRKEEHWRKLALDSGDPADYSFYSRCLRAGGRTEEADRMLDQAVYHQYGANSTACVHTVAFELIAQNRAGEALDLCRLCEGRLNNRMYLMGKSARAEAGRLIDCYMPWRHCAVVWQAMRALGKKPEAQAYLIEQAKTLSVQSRWSLVPCLIEAESDGPLGNVALNLVEQQLSGPPPLDIAELDFLLRSCLQFPKAKPQLAFKLAGKCLQARECNTLARKWIMDSAAQICCVFNMTGHFREGMQLAQEMIEYAVEVPLPDRNDYLLHAYAEMILATANSGDFRRSDAVYQEAKTLLKDDVSGRAVAVLLASEAAALRNAGRLHESLEFFKLALNAADSDSACTIGNKYGLLQSYAEACDASQMKQESRRLKERAELLARQVARSTGDGLIHAVLREP